jgi:cell division protein FtsN
VTVAAPTSKTLSRDYKHVIRQSQGTPAFNGWTGLAVGLAIGLAVALGVYLHFQGQIEAEPQPAAAARPASAKAPEDAPAAEPPANDYSFYDVLPKQEVEVPEREAGKARTAAPEGGLTLQVGAFKQPDEAERLQARLAQYGVDAKIQRFSLDDETWYRVRIGPVSTVEEVDALRAKLAEAEVEATPVTAEAEVPLP